MRTIGTPQSGQRTVLPPAEYPPVAAMSEAWGGWFTGPSTLRKTGAKVNIAAQAEIDRRHLAGPRRCDRGERLTFLARDEDDDTARAPALSAPPRMPNSSIAPYVYSL
jgi:hypothetical protein